MKPTFTRLGRLFVFVFFHCSLVLSAQIGPGIAPVSSPSGGFNIDGTLSSNSAIGDWVSGTGSGGFVLANSGTPLNIKTTYHLYDEYNSSTDNIFGGGDKVSDNPNSMSWTLGTANNKTDMNNALIHFTTDASGNVWFVFAADRLSNSGNAYIDFEFLQDELTKTATGFASTGSSVTGGRTQGDFLLTVYFENGAANFDIQHWENVSGTWQYKTYFSSLPLNSVYAAGNSTTVPVPYSAFGTNRYSQNTFIESAVNLTEVLGAIDPCANLKIKTIFVKSKTSTAPSASIKDFFEPLAVTNLTLGSADAGDDDTICSGGNYKLQGVAVPSSNYTVVSTTWSVLSGSATIASPNTLDSYVTINGSSATLRLTVETHPSNGIGTHCIVYDDVTITTTPSPSCSITGSNGPLCPSTIANNYAAPVSSSYSWSISGNGTLSGSTTSQTASVTAGQNCNASFTLTLNTTDTNGCTSECTKTVAVNDTTSPIITTTSGTLNHTLQCNNASGIADAFMEVPTATDNCSATPTMHLVSDVTTPTTDCANGYSRVRTWNFTDGCGNTSADFVQTITVIDDIAPVVTTISSALNHTLQCNNASGIADAFMEVPTATDNCSATPTMHLVSDVTTPTTDCANGYSRVRTWNFTDGCGNTSADFVQTITVIDDIAPVVTTISSALNHTLQCNNTSGITSALMEVPTATDNCSATPTMHLVSDVTTPTTDCTNGYSRVRTWNFTDDCDNTSSSFVQTITVIDDVAPIVSTISGTLNHTLQCNNTSGIESALAEVPTATDNCSATPTMQLVSDVTTPTTDCANGYSRVRTWNFTDDCGNTSANFVQTITVIDDVAPIVTTISGALNHTLQCNNTSGITAALMEVPTATDNCSATPTIHLVSDVTTPTTDCANGYSRVRTWNFTDDCGNTSANFVQTITVIDDVAPIVTTTSGALNHTLQCNNTSGIESALMEIPTATDNCSATPTMHLVSDVTTPTTDCANGYSRVRTWNFTDGCGNTSANFVQTIIVIDDVAPVVTTISGALNHTLQCSNVSGIESALMEVSTATDNCSATPTIHLVSDVTTPTTDCANGYSRVRTWNFTDGCGNTSANFVQTITVIDDVAPVVTTTSGTLNHALQCNNTSGIESALMDVPTATDNCSATPTMHLVSDITTPTTDCTNGYSRVRTWNFTDDCGNTSANFVQTITVIDDVAPIVTTTSGALNHTLQCNNTSGIESALMEIPTATDNCSATPTIHLVSDVTTPTTDCANGYSRVRTWNFTDDCGNTSANFVQTITVIDDVAPIVTTTSGALNHTLQCNNTSGIESALMEVPTATDNCSATPTMHLVSDVTTPTTDCANGYSRVRTWNFTDDCGNTSANFVQTITVIDDVAPIVTTISGALNHTLQCNNTSGIESALMEVPTATDNCSAAPTMHLVSDVTTPTTDCANGYSRVRTWNFTDDCDNTSSSFVQTITVIDDVAPIVSTISGTLNHTLQCNNTSGIESALAEVPTATDNCSATPTMQLVSDVTTPTTDCTNGYSRVRTWNFTDDCGNTSANFVQTITIIDDVAPVVTTISDALNHTLQCDDANGIESALAEIPTAADNCSATPTMHLVSDVNTPTTDCANGYSRVRTWNFTDDCGNTSTNFVQTITVIDDVAPVVTTISGALNHTLQCDNASGIASALMEVPTATDNCSATPTMHLVSDVNTPTTDCANGYSRVRTWNFTDDCGNTSDNFVQEIIVQDTIAPTFVETVPNNTTVECNTIPIPATLTAIDNCSEAIVVFSESELPGSCPESYTINRTWTATDSCGNQNSHTQIITVKDTTAPTFIAPVDITLNSDSNCYADISTTSTGIVTDIKDNCDPNPITSYEDSDCFGNFNSASVNSGTGNYFPFTVSGFDSITANNIKKVALAFETNQGKGRAEFVLVAPNGQGIVLVAPYCKGGDCDNLTSSEKELYLPVFYPNSSNYPKWDNSNPIVTNSIQNFTPNGMLSTTNTITGLSSLVSSFEEFTGDLNGNWFVFARKDGTEEGRIEFNSICLTPSTNLCGSNTIIVRKWSVSDACSNTVTFNQIIKIVDTTAPTWITEVESLNTSIECSDEQALANAQNLFPIASDNCDKNLNIVKVAGEFVASSTCATTGNYTNTWTVTDSCGNTSANFVQTITVIDDVAPVVSTISGTLNHTLQCNNASGIESALMDVPTATDNCSATPTMHLVSDITTPTTDCTNGYSRVRTWNFTDDCGNTSANFVQTITIIDDVAPVVTTISDALNHTLQCDDANGIESALAEIPTAADNCSATPTMYLVSDVTTPTTDCANGYSRVRTWNFTDDCGNTSANYVQTITVIDDIAPVVTTTSGTLNHTLQCNNASGITAALMEVPTATDNCSATPTMHLVIDVTTPTTDCANGYSRVRTWNFTDDCGNTSANFVQTITVIDDVAPVVTTTSGSLNHTLQCNNTSEIESALMEVPTATDNCSATPTMHLVSDVTTPDANCANTYSRVRTWNFTDDCGNTSANYVQTITVIDDVAPVVTTTSGSLNHTLQCNNTSEIESALMEVPTANDNCSATPTIHLVSDVTTPTTDCANGYSRVRTWNFTDDCGNTSANYVQTITVIDNIAPVVTTTSGTLNHTIQCNNTSGIESALMEVPTATDNCSATPTMHLVSDVTTPTTDCTNGYSRVRTWNFTDGCGNTSANFVQEIIVQDTTSPIWITQVGSLNTTIECNDAQALANAQNSFPIASDNCDTTLNNIKKTAGEFVASSTCANSGTYTNTWTVTDDCGNNSETFTQVITIQDSESPKMITKATDIVVECDGQGNQNAITNWLATNGGAIASDNCSEIIWTNNFNSIANDCSAAVTVVFTATDACGNSTSTSGTFSVQDNTPPTVPDSPTSITVGCAAEIPEMISLTANDNCSGNITVEGINTIELGDCDATYTIKRTWTFRDACNNISTVSQTINVVDTTAPTIAQLPEPSTISCPNTPIFAQATATDECGLNFSLTYKDVKTEGNCTGSYSITRTWTAADSCGNSTTASQTITVQDTTGPVFSSLPEPTTISCPNTPVFAFATATDECGSDFSLTFNDVKTEGNCAGSYSITRTWTATDTCGNSATASQTITIEDTTGPITTTEFSTNTTANCDAIPAKPELVFVDACSTVLPASFSETISNLTADSYVINRKWIVSDSCGNASEFIQTVNVTITNSLTSLSGTICNDGETTSIDLTSLFPVGTPTNGTWTDVSNTGKLVGNTFNAASLSVGDYLFEYIINDTNCPRTIRITMSVTTGCGGIVLPCGTIVIHNAFSPNGDGINEKFVIDNINDTNCYPDNTVEIYNRWGVLVYSTKGYNNTTNAFDGISDGRSTVSQSSGLPAGTYFYILTYTSFDNNNVIQTNKKEGYLFLTK